MRIDLSKDPIEVTRKDGAYDDFVLDFLARFPTSWKHVLVSGYVAILFGRERQTEDIDLLVAEPTDAEFLHLWAALHPDYWCLQTDTLETARDGYLRDGIALRFAKAGKIEPNFEVKLPHDEAGLEALEHRVHVRLNGRSLWTSPFEQQLAYKLWLGSEKDLEDARHLAGVLADKLNKDEFHNWCDQLRIPQERRRLW